jgi:hypothetical protein
LIAKYFLANDDEDAARPARQQVGRRDPPDPCIKLATVEAILRVESRWEGP